MHVAEALHLFLLNSVMMLVHGNSVLLSQGQFDS